MVAVFFHLGYEDGTENSEMLTHKIQTPGNHPKERIQHSEHNDSLKSEKYMVLCRKE
jgi:hypothetical protein